MLKVPYLIAAAIAASSLVQAREAADAIVRSATPIIFEVPTGDTTRRVLQTVLDAAGVRYGLEQAPLTANAALIDFGRAPERTIELSGMRLGDALDAIVREDPRYEWTESNGRILVRLAAGREASALDARVGRFTVNHASYSDALARLTAAIDPSRPAPALGHLTAGFSLGDMSRTPPPPKAEPRISLTLDGAPVVEILDAIARAHGALSWHVSYGRGPVDLDHASITLTSGPASATAESTYAKSDAALARTRLVVPVIHSLDSTLTLYTRRARILAGIEFLPGDADRPSAGAAALLDLTGVAPAEAVARIVALDSRFEWEEAGGIFYVHPRLEHAVQPSLLDRNLETITFTNQTAEGVLGALAKVLGAKHAGRASSAGSLVDVDPAEQARLIAEGRAKTISLTVTDNTLREVLNTVCRAHGTLSWKFRTAMSQQGQVSYSIDFESYDGWSVSTTFWPAPSF